jgi:sec-independent protein translocase protein TatA
MTNHSFPFLLSMPGGSELILIVVVILLIFGGKKIPELMRGLGKGMKEFKDAKENVTNEFEKGMQPTQPTTPAPLP